MVAGQVTEVLPGAFGKAVGIGIVVADKNARKRQLADAARTLPEMIGGSRYGDGWSLGLGFSSQMTKDLASPNNAQ